MKPKILIVDDEKMLRDTLAKWFRPVYDCLTAPDAAEAMRLVEANPDIALMISDVKMPGEDGVALLRKAKAKNPNMACILLTAYGTVDLAVEAMKTGADDFFQKPITDLKAFELRVSKAVRNAELAREPADDRNVSSDRGELAAFTGTSPAMERVYRLIRKVAPTDATVLIEGPSGSGKELAARAIHALSRRATGPFIALECSAFQGELLKSELFGYEPGTFTGGLSEGKRGCIESAAGGTLFLDEIGEIDASTQVTLLRALETKSVRRLGGIEEKPVDFRLVAATNKNLAKLVADGTFREDLYYRLDVIDIRTPALKDHPEDIAALADRFIREFSAANGGRVTGIEPEALQALEGYSWPGNVRQLRNVMEKTVILASGEKISVDDLPAEITAAPTREPAAAQVAAAEPAPAAGLSLQETEKRQILAALAAAKNNKTKAADALGISRRTLHRKLKEWGVEE